MSFFILKVSKFYIKKCYYLKMVKKSKYLSTLTNVNSVEEALENALKLLENFNIKNYHYSPNEAVEELGLDLEIVEQLVQDYVIQIMNASSAFVKHHDVLQNSQENGDTLKYDLLRDLAHKNLGVARNLRIKDAEKLLKIIMNVDDLDYVLKALEALVACAIKLKPKAAYDTLVLIKIKTTF